MELSPRYFEHIMERLRQTDWVNFVKDRINRVKYRFAQVKRSVSNSFCSAK